MRFCVHFLQKKKMKEKEKEKVMKGIVNELEEKKKKKQLLQSPVCVGGKRNKYLKLKFPYMYVYI